jgi:hypothetical protein
MEKKDLSYHSIIPADRVIVNGKQSKHEAYLYWLISDVYSFNRRSSQVFSIKSGSIETDKDWTIIRDGHGQVPLKVIFDIQETSKTATVIF